ncbi:MAG: MBL fold metallo-hydrolase [Bacteroidetes bacterium]|nr:MAG: MBL fold metallo-hydrolase [Bacteroidota bacterium]
MIHILDLQFQTDHTIASFLVETEAGPVLIETGPHSVYEHLRAGLARHGYQPEDVRHVLLSHIHFDHAGAAWTLARSGATVYVHPAGYKHLQDPTRLYQSAQRIYGDQMEILWGQMHGIPETQLVAVADETALSIGGKTFVAWHTPGHASHHIAWQLDDVIFTGDVGGVMIEGGPVVPPCPPPDIDIEAWFESLQRIERLAPRRLYLTHYGAVDAVSAHLASLRTMLKDWAKWMKPHFEAGTDPKVITPQFQAYADEQLRQAGLDPAGLARYEAANPAWMSVAGLLRYWRKRTEKQADRD